MSALDTDTIAALATPIGRSAVAMFRLSGEDAFAVCDRVLTHRLPTASYATQTLHRALVVEGYDTVDDVLVAVFHAPRSYTGENVVEITCHGGAVPVRRILALLLASGARLADPGEFTLRAYLNGKLDLAQAEAICDAIEARTDEAFHLAKAQQAGVLSRAAATIRDRLLGIVARVEATIDFPEDVGELPNAWCAAELDAAGAALADLIATADRGMLYREGISVVLAGPPNAGKSSLLNALLRSDRAIVTALPGTTRDVIEESIAIRGIPVRLVDTAGLREAMDEIEKIGVNRSRERIRSADIVLLVRDATDRSAAVAIEDVPCGVACITVWNKIDLDGSFAAPGTDTAVSALTGQGIALLEERIADTALAGVSGEPRDADGPVVTHARHNHALESALDAIGRARAVLDSGEPLDFFSIELQCALDAVGLISGETTSPDIVTEIFHRFCIGK